MSNVNEFDLVIAPITVYLCENKKQYKKVLRVIGHQDHEFISPLASATTKLVSSGNGLSCAVICMDYKSVAKEHGADQAVSLLAHECLHVAQHATEVMGVADTRGEFEAYCMQRVMLWALSVYGGVNGERSAKEED
ncbi:MAG: hypothetical protein ACRCW5_10930 [Cetobacterium sp.]|uniref:hypothetical protein n=1 Tax=Cetobacterium sp. TaxID=2071632 RepID=UPI003F389049